jgi:hypothetical protein
MVAQCWKKMYRRITHPSSQGFIYILGRVTKEELEVGFDLYAAADVGDRFPKENDSMLGGLLVKMHERGQIQSVIMAQCGKKELSSQRLEHLVAISKELQLQSGKEPKGRLGVYSKDTCWEFHIFLLATLLSYGRALVLLQAVNQVIDQDLNGQKRKEKKMPAELKGLALKALTERRVHYAEQLRQCAIVLWRIAYSRALRLHLSALRRGGILGLPTNGNINFTRYQLYTGFSSISCPSLWPSDEDEDGPHGCATDDEDDELQGIRDESTGFNEVFHHWIRLQVTHWAVLEAASSSARAAAAPHRLDVSLVVVNHPNINKELQLEPWRTTVTHLLARRSIPPSTDANFLNAEAVIETITRHIQQKGTLPWANGIFCAFRNDPAPVDFCGNIHGEVALASLQKYRALGCQAESVVGLIQVTFYLHGLHTSWSDRMTEYEPKYDWGVKAMLPCLLCAFRYSKR